MIAERGAAATSHPLATLIAIDTLRAGGNAIDAAIAAAAALAVIEPAMTGIGGDCFVLIAPKGSDRIIAYNGNGRAPLAASAEWFLDRGIGRIAPDSVHAVTVPGAVEAWCRLSEDHGKLGIDRLLQPAIQLARKGFIVAPRVASDWARDAERLRADPAARATHAAQGQARRSAGDRIAFPALAKALSAIAKRRARSRSIAAGSPPTWCAGCGPRAACTGSRISPATKATTRRRSRPPIAGFASSNARRRARG